MKREGFLALTDEEIRRRRYRRIRAGAAQEDLLYFYPELWTVWYEGSVVISSGTPNFITIYPFSGTFDIGDIWRITWNGTEYILPTHYAPDNQTIIIGNIGIAYPAYDDGSGVPFFAFKSAAYRIVFNTNDPTGTITLKIEEQG